MIGGQVGISGHIKLADGVKLGAQSGVANNINTEDAILIGSPAIDASIFRRSSVVFKKLPELLRRIDELEKKVSK